MLKLSLKQQQRVMIISFLFIPLLLLCVFSFYPATQLFSLSMTDWDGYAEVKNYVGFENYQSLLDDPAQLEPFLNTFYYFAGAVIQICLALWFAILVNSKLMGRNLFKTLLFIPFVLNTVAASMVFQIFYQVDGALDNFLQAVGLAGWIQPWLQDAGVVPWSLVAASIWRYLGFNLILFFGVLQSIPQDQYEAARIEGAGEWQQFRFITLPSIKLVFGLQVFLAFVGSLSVFDIPMIITKGANGTKTFVMATLETAFTFNDFGLASAMAVVLLLVVIAFMLLQRLLFRESK
ncbi:MAG: sugar ABC transporter permease [Aeromonadaceae bacterium]|jgi:ABC-type sugar transport systems, permease components|nr:sugar ABC transporter permease [Aeromonadaceae bacterium]